MERKLLEILERNSRISLEQLAAVLEISEAEVAELMAKLEQDRVVLGYHAVIDWEKANRELVTALIEVKVTPQRGLGFDNIAERIYQYPEVTSVFLMSGGFDLTVIIEGKTMKDVAMFVSQKLAPMEGVQS
ncbi:MAG: Lrp/AsnC family transcriptional regulator, partial [Limnochordia bacterium]